MSNSLMIFPKLVNEIAMIDMFVYLLCLFLRYFSRDYIAKQKEESNEVGKFSVRSLHKISEEINNLSLSLATVSSAVHRCLLLNIMLLNGYGLCEKLLICVVRYTVYSILSFKWMDV